MRYIDEALVGLTFKMSIFDIRCDYPPTDDEIVPRSLFLRSLKGALRADSAFANSATEFDGLLWRGRGCWY
jgi:hypothetical protein